MNSPTPAELVNAARFAAALDGCTCTPEIEIETDDYGIHHAHIAHDTWCALLTRRAAPWN